MMANGEVGTGAAIEVLVVQPDPADPLCELDGWLRAANLGWQVVQPFAGTRVPTKLESDGLIVLGGDMSSLDDALYPWLEDVRSLQRNAASQQKPSLGICLGAQLMAQAFGGRTAVGSRGLESGIVEVEWLREAEEDLLMADLPAPFLAGTMHGDEVIELPDGATWLGRGTVYPHQAFRVGATSWGVQFHPEINLQVYTGWVEDHHTPTVEDLHRLTNGAKNFRRVERDVLDANRTMVRKFAGIVDSTASAGHLAHEPAGAVSGLENEGQR